jgi:tetratricopeptide (TPR) repeat protein
MLDGWEALGKAYVRAGRVDQAVRAFSKVIELEPTKAETHLALAKIYAAGNKPELARQHAEIAAAKSPAEAFQTLAESLMAQGQLDRAAEYAGRSVAADGTQFMSHFILGVAAHQAGRCDEAVRHYSTAESEKRRHKRAIVRNLHARMADCLVRLGRPADAEREFLAEIEEIPASAEARVGLAMFYQSMGRPEQARASIEGLIAVQRAPNPSAYWTVIRTLRVLGDPTAASRWVARARADFPDDPRFR